MVNCPFCGEGNPATAKFCPECGKSLFGRGKKKIKLTWGFVSLAFAISLLGGFAIFHISINFNFINAPSPAHASISTNADPTDGGPTQVPPTPTTQQPTTSYPHLAASYSGFRHNTVSGDSETFTLTSVVQNNSQIRGVATIADGAHGSGPFTGVVNGNSINFAETTNDNSGTITFTGTVHLGGSISGTFVYPGYGQGTWQVLPD